MSNYSVEYPSRAAFDSARERMRREARSEAAWRENFLQQQRDLRRAEEQAINRIRSTPQSQSGINLDNLRVTEQSEEEQEIQRQHSEYLQAVNNGRLDEYLDQQERQNRRRQVMREFDSQNGSSLPSEDRTRLIEQLNQKYNQYYETEQEELWNAVD